MTRPQLTPQRIPIEPLPCLYPNAAGVDIGGAEIIVAVPPDRDSQPVRAFRTFTADLEALVTWLLACGIDTVAMESTGIYWIPLYELLEQAGILPVLVNAQQVRMAPGRKTDWNDAQWRKHAAYVGAASRLFSS
jgi:transposase